MNSHRKGFWLVAVVLIAILVLWLHYREQLFNYSPWASHAAWLSVLTLFVLGMIVLQNEAADELTDQLTEFIVSVFMAVAISIILVGEENQNFLEKEELIKTATIAFVIFAVTTLGRSGRSLKQSATMLETINRQFEEFKEGLAGLRHGITQQGELYAKNQNLFNENQKLSVEGHKVSRMLQEATSDALKAIGEAQFGGLAARALGLQQTDLLMKTSGELDIGIIKAVTPGLGALRAWVQVGKELEDDPARAAWWQVMSVYHQEEVYDVSSQEIATNVRSYAYILLAVVSRLLGSLTDDEKLVIANASAFAPKDFYNFPNGQKGNRFYHEAEFFGIYRRLLAAITVDSNVDPYRIVFADPAMKLPPNVRTQSNGPGSDQVAPRREAVGDGSQLGWHLDPIWKLILDCARLHIISWPIVGPRSSSEGEDFTPMERRAEWGAAFPVESDPARRLPYTTTKFLWAPTYADVSNLFREVTQYHTREEWLKRVWEYEKENIRCNYEGFQEKATPNASSELQTRIEAMRARRESFCCIYLDDKADRANLCARLDGSWQRIIDDLVSWLPLGNSAPATVSARLDRIAKSSSLDRIHADLGELGIASPFIDEIERYIRLVTQAWSASVKLRDLYVGQPDYTKTLLDLADSCHQIDSLGKYLQIETRRATVDPDYSSAGVELGPAENWLHRLLILLEADRLGDEVRRNGPLPLWRLMAHDLCGVAIHDPMELKSVVAQRLRICTVGRKDDAQGCAPTATTGDEMNAAHIFPEFLMVGKLIKGASGLETVNWLALVGATISEPYQSCRIQLRFGKDDERIKAHAKWFKDKWEMGKVPTESFLDLLTREIECLGLERSAEPK